MEQDLIENLIIESIKIYGHDVYYLPRTLGAKDELLNEDDLPIFNDSYYVDMYIRNVEGFEGEGDFLSKFGLQIRDSITFAVAIRTFDAEVGAYTEEVRPNEGDLIYLPLNQKMFEVQHVEHEAIFYQMGQLQIYELRCELFEYSNQRFETGVDEIDQLFKDYVTTSNNAIANIESVDFLGDNFTIEQEADDVIDFSENNPFSESPDY
jgi:hypothetical protein